MTGLIKAVFGLALCILISGDAAAKFAYQPAEAVNNEPAERSGKDHIAKILAVLETRNADRKILARATEKLLTLPGAELHLLSSLCDRISRDNDTAGAEIAFALITALIVLS